MGWVERNSSWMGQAILAATVVLFCKHSAAGGFDAWSRHGMVTVNTASDGADIPADVRDFPLLLRLDRGNFDFTEALRNGEDIRFSLPGGSTPLPHQIDHWDSAVGRADIWIRMDRVKGASREPSFEMHWCNPAATGLSDGAAVFDSASGFVAVWHLGGKGTRANAVTGGNPAQPVRFDGDESMPGMIGLADSLDGAAEGDYLDLGDGFADFSGGFTYSVWTKPEAPLRYAKLLDLGNAGPRDNITLFRVETSEDLAFTIFDDSTGSKRVIAPAVLGTPGWRHITVTMEGRTARVYSDGKQVHADTLAFTIPTVKRTLNFLGRSNWASNEYYRGKLDEATLARVARSPAWIRLAYATQVAGATVVSLRREVACRSAFAAPSDTEVVEGVKLVLRATADCALRFSWTQLTGPALRILDPDSKELHVDIPRISGDTLITLAFSSGFPDGERSQTVRVRIRETIPDPVFQLPVSLNWNGQDTLSLRFAVTNIAAVRASPDSAVHRTWSLEGLPVDTLWTADGLKFSQPQGSGRLYVGLCLHNRGALICDTTVVHVGPASGVRPPGLRPSTRTPLAGKVPADYRDIRGRKSPSTAGRHPAPWRVGQEFQAPD